MDGTGPVSGSGVTCVCGALNIDNLNACHQCGQGGNLAAMWETACGTYEQLGIQAAVTCFDGLEQGDASNCAKANAPQSTGTSATSTVGILNLKSKFIADCVTDSFLRISGYRSSNRQFWIPGGTSGRQSAGSRHSMVLKEKTLFSWIIIPTIAILFQVA